MQRDHIVSGFDNGPTEGSSTERAINRSTSDSSRNAVRTSLVERLRQLRTTALISSMLLVAVVEWIEVI